MKNKSNTTGILFLFVTLIFLLTPCTGKGQTLGNPTLLEQHSWSVGVMGDQAQYILDDHKYLSLRGMIKFDFSVKKGFDLALIAGMANMKIYYPKKRFRTRFNGRNSFAFGGTAKVITRVPGMPQFRLFGETGGLRFTPIGHSVSTSQLNPGDFYLKFDWREFWGSIGTIFSYKPYDIYIGYHGRVIHQYEMFSREKFNSGLLSGIIMGLDFHLPQQYLLNAQLRFLNGSAVSIGISQTGKYPN